MISRSCVWPDERDDIQLLSRSIPSILPIPDVDHSLVDLYRMLRFSARRNELVYLSAERKR
jgi:hypothetical protein